MINDIILRDRDNITKYLRIHLLCWYRQFPGEMNQHVVIFTREGRNMVWGPDFPNAEGGYPGHRSSTLLSAAMKSIRSAFERAEPQLPIPTVPLEQEHLNLVNVAMNTRSKTQRWHNLLQTDGSQLSPLLTSLHVHSPSQGMDHGYLLGSPCNLYLRPLTGIVLNFSRYIDN